MVRKDKAKNIKKVTRILAKNPLATDREIAKEAKIGLGTSNRAKQEVEQNGTKDPNIIAITDKDREIIQLGQNEINKRLQSETHLKEMRTTEISQVIRESTTRYSLFRGEATDPQGGMRTILTPEQMQVIAGRYGK